MARTTQSFSYLKDAFAGGIDTTVVTTTWIMSELMRNPRVMQKAQAEVHNIVKNKSKVYEEDIQNMKYLKMIIKENCRLHPPGTLLIPRHTMKTCTIGGYSVPSKTRIYVNGMKEEDIDMDEIGQLAFRKKLPLLIVPMKH
uniref:Uncharacterized protein n=1 Tax=Oryza rufipogon TaxID=4529 RepID=A0A0E0Q6S8_ORYRU